MKFSDELLSALGAWQQGWCEDSARRMVITKELQAAVDAAKLPIQLRSVSRRCYRKRFLVPNNPENGGDLGLLFLSGQIDEGVASWTTDLSVALTFKNRLRDNCFSALFARNVLPQEVVLNIVALWEMPEFRNAVSDYHTRGGEYAAALTNFKALQSEVIIKAPLLYDELIGFYDKSSSFDDLCNQFGVNSEEQKDFMWSQLVDGNNIPEEPTWLSSEGTRKVLDRTRERFRSKFGGLLNTADGAFLFLPEKSV